MTATNTAQRIAYYLSALPGEQIKAVMLEWTTSTDISLTALEQALASENETLSEIDAYAETKDFSATFPSMGEAGMVEASLQSLAEYQRTGEGFTQEEMEDWSTTLKSD